nr:serine/threonine-protein kinase [Streptomyces sp. HNM0574]
MRRPLGSGGMGVVWEALDTRLERQVAVKGLLFRGVVDPETQSQWVTRARREAQAIARIGHQNVVSVHDVIEADSQVWIVMELLDARSLAELLREQPLAVPHAARIGLQVLRGLRAAHEAGVLHRDVKPANVLFRPNGRALLMDFGIATFEGAAQVTRSRELIGTPMYTAPELVGVALGEPGRATPASDLWSLGVTLYEMVEGRKPFSGTTLWEIYVAVREKPVRPMRYAGPLRPVIEALLRKDPGRRPTAAETEDLLEAVLTEEPVPGARRPRERRMPGWRVPAAAAAALAVLAGGYVAWPDDPGPKPPDTSPGGPDSDRLSFKEDRHPKLIIGVKKDQPGLSVQTAEAEDGKSAEFEGFEIDLAHAIAKELGYDREDVVFRPVASKNRSSELRTGRVHLVLATYSIDKKRRAKEAANGTPITMVGPYYLAGRGLMVRTKHKDRFADSSDLVEDKAEVCTAQDSTYPGYLKSEGYRVKAVDSYQVCLEEMENENPGNEVYAVSTDDIILQGYRQKKEYRGEFTMLENLNGFEQWGVGMSPVPPDSKSRLDLEVRDALREIIEGKTWEKLYQEHLSDLVGKNAPALSPDVRIFKD